MMFRWLIMEAETILLVNLKHNMSWILKQDGSSSWENGYPMNRLLWGWKKIQIYVLERISVIRWIPISTSWNILSVNSMRKPYPKALILSLASQIFNPLELLSPIIITTKLIMQDIALGLQRTWLTALVFFFVVCQLGRWENSKTVSITLHLSFVGRHEDIDEFFRLVLCRISWNQRKIFGWFHLVVVRSHLASQFFDETTFGWGWIV